MSKPLALTLGEPAGIGPDITLQAWLRRTELGLPAFYLLGDPGFISQRAALLGLDVPVTETHPGQAVEIFSKALPVVP
ncbi:MAG: 4-hydroxythreonine-4-phosphate dehydrogenase, partial [Bradyrhizobium sp.]|nr:4-hydroxythreonine-4-phosphate dehydrogenase [Bradyrhizobium sp.]